MVKSFTAITHEIDDTAAAVSEILAQLDFDGAHPPAQNSVGIVSCYAEFVSSGVWAALCEALPFEVIGATTIANMAAGEVGDMCLTLTVLTADDVSFATGLTEPVAVEDPAPLREAYGQAAARLPGTPALMLSYAPLLNTFSPEFYVDSMTDIARSVPNFGTLAVDHNPDYRDSQVLLNGRAYRDRFAMLLIHGPIAPRFYMGTISGRKIFSEKSVATDAERNLLKTVDGMAVVDYLQSLGLQKNDDGSIAGINSFPLIVDYGDGTRPAIRTMFAITPEGYAVCGGTIPQGATLEVGAFDEDEIVATTQETVEAALAAGPYAVILMYSCIGRYFALGYHSEAEYRSILPALDACGAAYMAAYSGGELCPVYGRDGETVNRSHGNTFILCAF